MTHPLITGLAGVVVGLALSQYRASIRPKAKHALCTRCQKPLRFGFEHYDQASGTWTCATDAENDAIVAARDRRNAGPVIGEPEDDEVGI